MNLNFLPKELLPEVYHDLLQPGVQVLGQTLGDTLELATCFRWLFKIGSEKARQLALKRIYEIQKKMEEIPEKIVVKFAQKSAFPFSKNCFTRRMTKLQICLQHCCLTLPMLTW